jgi:copper transport outer membrane protein MctB
MINFRFHIISLVAVFLALAIGIFLGSAVGEPTIVDNLNKTIDQVRTQSNERRRENSQLRDQNGDLQDFIDKTAGFTVADSLTGSDVVIVAERGVDRGTVNDTRDMLQYAGANAPMVLWLEPRFALTEQKDIDALATILESSATDRTVLRTQAFNAIARRLVQPDTTTTTRATTETTTAPKDLLTRLDDAKFVQVDGLSTEDLSTYPTTRGSAVVVDGIGSDLDDPDVFTQAVAAFMTRGATTVAAEIGSDSTDPGAPERGETLAAIRGDSDLNKRVSTVDDLDLMQGRIATTLALRETGANPNGPIGNYGYGDGVQGPAPAPPQQ